MGPGEIVLRSWFEEIWNKGRIELYPQMAQPDAVFHSIGVGSETLIGLAGFRTLYDPLRAAFSDIKFSIEETVQSGNAAAIRWTCTMKHTGGQLGVAATGNAVTATGMAFAHFRDGKIAEAWDEWSRLDFMKQVGLL